MSISKCDNLEGIRITNGNDGSFFMLRKSLHDPVLSLQIEASDKTAARDTIVGPILSLLESEPQLQLALEFSALQKYVASR